MQSSPLDTDGMIPWSQNHDGARGHSCSQHEVIMAIEMSENDAIGCAYFTVSDGFLYLSDDIPSASFVTAEQFLVFVQPTALLVSGRNSESFLAFLESQAVSSTGSPKFVLRTLSSSNFSNCPARERLASAFKNNISPTQAIFTGVGVNNYPHMSNAFADDGFSSRTQNIPATQSEALSSINNPAAFNCATAILNNINWKLSADSESPVQSENGWLRIKSLRKFSLSDYMFVDMETFYSLHIISDETHPNSQSLETMQGGSGAKEGLSMYGLFRAFISTSQGRSELRQLLLRPTLKIETIEERQQTICILLHPKNATGIRAVTSILRKIHNIRKTVTQLHLGIESLSWGQSSIWTTLRLFLSQSLKLKHTVEALCGDDGTQITDEFLSNIDSPSLALVGEVIEKTVDLDQSVSQNRLSIKAGVDPELDELKRKYAGIGSFLTEIVAHVINDLPNSARKNIQSCIYLPQVGFLVVVEAGTDAVNNRNGDKESVFQSWDQLFTTDGSLFYKNQYMKELDNQYGDIYCEIGDREIEVIHHLATIVLQYEHALVSASDACGKFDAILALAMAAETYDWIKPHITADNVLQIHSGRHPLQELAVVAFVPNDCHLSGVSLASSENARALPQGLLISGPNHSGKSVYLKQVALITYLTHIGSFVPAKSAVIGVTDKLLARIATTESMSRHHSAFAMDLMQVVQIVRSSTSQSLIIVDEFGKGTNTDDGVGLLAALLNHFLSPHPSSPRILIATHFHELFGCGFLNEYDRLYLGHMDVATSQAAKGCDDQVTYFYELRPGHVTASLGGKCAAMNGIPSTIVNRAEEISLLMRRKEDLRSTYTRISESEEKRLGEAETTARRFLLAVFRQSSHISSDNAEEGQGIRRKLQNILSVDS